MNDLVQLGFDYSSLDADTRAFVQEKAQSIHARLKRTAEDIIAIGQDLQAVQQKLKEKNQTEEKQGNGQFLLWLEDEFEMSQATAYNFMSVAKRFGEKLLTVRSFSPKVLYALASPGKVNDEVIEMVETGQIQPTLEEIKKAKEALKRVEELERQARAETELAQRQLTQVRHNWQSEVEEFNRQIAALQSQIETISTPEVQIQEVEKQVVPPEMAAQLEALQRKVSTLTEQRDNLSKEAKELGEIAREATIKRNASDNEERIRQQWRTSCINFTQVATKTLGQWPTPIDIQVFEADDWAYLSHAQNTARRFLEECSNLHRGNMGVIVDAMGT